MDFQTAYEQFSVYMINTYYDEIKDKANEEGTDIFEWINDRMREEVGDWVKENLSYEQKMEIITDWGFKDALDTATLEYGVDIREVEDPADFIVQGLIHSVFSDKNDKVIEAVMNADEEEEDLSCHHCGMLPAPFYHEGQRRCEEHNKDLC